MHSQKRGSGGASVKILARNVASGVKTGGACPPGNCLPVWRIRIILPDLNFQMLLVGLYWKVVKLAKAICCSDYLAGVQNLFFYWNVKTVLVIYKFLCNPKVAMNNIFIWTQRHIQIKIWPGYGGKTGKFKNFLSLGRTLLYDVFRGRQSVPRLHCSRHKSAAILFDGQQLASRIKAGVKQASTGPVVYIWFKKSSSK